MDHFTTGFTDHLTFLVKFLNKFWRNSVSPHMCLLQYVDDLLLSGVDQNEVANMTIAFLVLGS